MKITIRELRTLIREEIEIGQKNPNVQTMATPKAKEKATWKKIDTKHADIFVHPKHGVIIQQPERNGYMHMYQGMPTVSRKGKYVRDAFKTPQEAMKHAEEYHLTSGKDEIGGKPGNRYHK